METVGAQLKAAREAHDLTISQVAEVTRIKSQQIEGIERGDFSSIPAPMYVKGFIKLYAQVVDLEPEPLLACYEAQIKADKPGKPKVRTSQKSVVAPPAVAADGTPEGEVEPVPPPNPRAPHLRPPGRYGPRPSLNPDKTEAPPAEPGVSVMDRMGEQISGLVTRVKQIQLPAIKVPETMWLKTHWQWVAGGAVVLVLLIGVPRACSRGPAMDFEGGLPLSNPNFVEPAPYRFTLDGFSE